MNTGYNSAAPLNRRIFSSYRGLPFSLPRMGVVSGIITLAGIFGAIHLISPAMANSIIPNWQSKFWYPIVGLIFLGTFRSFIRIFWTGAIAAFWIVIMCNLVHPNFNFSNLLPKSVATYSYKNPSYQKQYKPVMKTRLPSPFPNEAYFPVSKQSGFPGIEIAGKNSFSDLVKKYFW